MLNGTKVIERNSEQRRQFSCGDILVLHAVAHFGLPLQLASNRVDTKRATPGYKRLMAATIEALRK
jgi:hypothetical protein